MKPGDCHYYPAGAVHSPNRTDKSVTRLIRVEGANLDHIQRSNIEAA
jgi:mannose-6-phosphate isomerase-like protein (cupin superfamily)